MGEFLSSWQDLAIKTVSSQGCGAVELLDRHEMLGYWPKNRSFRALGFVSFPMELFFAM